MQAARQRSFHVRRLNQMNLNQRQRGAQRRNLWKRGKGNDGQLRWYRTDDHSHPRVLTSKDGLETSTNTSGFIGMLQDSTTSSSPISMLQVERSSDREIEIKMEGTLAQLIMSPRLSTQTGIRKDPQGCTLQAQNSVGYVRHVDDDGNVSWVPAGITF